MTGWYCGTCKWIGTEPDFHKSYEKLDEFPGIYGVYETCPDCSSDDLFDINVCETCTTHEAEPGFDDCRTCLREHAVCEAEMAFDAQVENLLEAK